MTYVSRHKKAIKDPIVDLKKKTNKAKLDKRKLLQAHEDEEIFFIYHFFKYNENKHSAHKNGYLSYNKLKRLNTKIQKLSDK